MTRFSFFDIIPSARGALTALLSMLLAFPAPLLAEAPAPDRPLWRSAIDSELNRMLARMSFGDPIEFNRNGSAYSARYIGRDCIGGRCVHFVDYETRLGPARAGNPNAGDGPAGAARAPAGGRGESTPAATPRTAAPGAQPRSSAPPPASLGANIGASAQAAANQAAWAGALAGADAALISTPEREASLEAARQELASAWAAMDASQTAMERAIANRGGAARDAVQTGATAMSLSLEASNGLADAVAAASPRSPAATLSEPSPAFDRAGDAEFEVRARAVWDRIAALPAPRSNTQANARNVAKAAVFVAVGARGDGEIEVANTALAVAGLALNVSLSLNPFTAAAMDAYGLFTGRDIVTGAELEDWERALAGVSLAGDLVSMGAASTVAQAAKAFFRILNRTRADQIARNVGIYGSILGAAEALKKIGAESGARIVDFLERATRPSFASMRGAEDFAGALESAGREAGGASAQTLSRVYRSTWETEAGSLAYHLGKHGGGRTAERYLDEAQTFFREYQSQATPVLLNDGSEGLRLKLRLPDGNGVERKIGGYFKADGRVVTFWDR